MRILISTASVFYGRTDETLTLSGSKNRVVGESTIDIATRAAAIDLHIVVVDWAPLLELDAILLLEEEICRHSLRFATQISLEAIFLDCVLLPEE